MASKVGYPLISAGLLTDNDSTQKNPLGQRAFDEAGNEYIYLKGVASTLAKDAVTFNESTYLTTRLIANAVGPVAVALAAVVASQFGWYQIYGVGSVNSDTVAANKALYIDGTTGRVDDASVAGDWISGMTSLAADVSNVLAVFLDYPHVYDGGYLV